MSIYIGNNKVSGNAKVSSLPLFTTQWQDHITNDASWLRSEPFSWQSGAVYVSAYNHLVNDLIISVETLYCWNRPDKEVYTTKENPSIGDNVYIINNGIVEFASTIDNISGNVIYPSNMQAYTRYSSGDINNQEVPVTAETETIAGTTITFCRATDGHKIVLPDQESNVEAIYTATGMAWYYILDTTNQRFKLPRSSHGNIVEKYQNGTNWYRLWSDGFCEQGGVVSVVQIPEGQDVNLLKSYGSTNYTLSISLNTVAASWSAEANPRAVQGLTSFHIQSGGVVNPSNMSWIAYGFLSTTPENPQYKYLYFYVGNTVQNQTFINIGEITEVLDEKVDLPVGVDQSDVDYIIESYVNGTSWYRVYKSGWCEQGGTITGDYVQVYFLKPYADANYNIQITLNSSTEVAAAYAAVGVRGSVTSTYFEAWGGSTVGYKFWMTSGYISLS